MKNVMLICNAGMSSSVMAKKTTKFLQEKGEDIQVDATTVASADKVFTSDKYDLILVSPQIRMKFDELNIDEWDKAYKLMKSGETIKIVLKPLPENK